MSSGEGEIGLGDAYSVDGPAENRELYARWASTYEQSFIAAEGYRYHQRVAHIFANDGGSGPVLDIGCGTGVVGVELRRLGLSPVDGVDISAAMLGEAAVKTDGTDPTYRNLLEADLTGPLDIASGSYQGLVSAGAFTHGHLGPESLDELVRVAAPGALCVIGINSGHFSALGFEGHLDALISDGWIGGYEVRPTPIYEDTDTSDSNRIANVTVFEVS